MKIQYDGKTVEIADSTYSEIDVNSLCYPGPIGSCGFRSGSWLFKFRGQEYRTIASVPHRLDFDKQDEIVRRQAAVDLLRAGIVIA